jgi:hypothetical protein
MMMGARTAALKPLRAREPAAGAGPLGFRSREAFDSTISLRIVPQHVRFRLP